MKEHKSSKQNQFTPFGELPKDEQEKWKRSFKAGTAFKSPEEIYNAAMKLQIYQQRPSSGQVGGFPSGADQANNYIKWNR